MRKLAVWILVMVFPLIMLSSCSLSGNEYKNLCGFTKSLIGKDISSAESMIEKQYGIELTRGEPAYRNSASLKGTKISEDYYEYKVVFTTCGIQFDTICLIYNNFKNDGYDGTICSVQFTSHQMSRSDAEKKFKTFSDEYSKFLKVSKDAESIGFEDDLSVSSSYVERNYHFFFDYYYSAHNNSTSFSAGCSGRT